MKRISAQELKSMERRFRAQLVNSITGFKSVGLVGTKNVLGNTNLSVMSSFVHLGSNPALMACIFRPDSVERHSLSNIMETGYYTFNHINEAICLQAHQASARYPLGVSEFSITGLSEEYKDGFWAPYCRQSHVQVGLEFRERKDLDINGAIMVIGEVKELYIQEDCLSSDGYLDIEKSASITCSGLDSYHKTNRIFRLSYAKIDHEVKIIDP